ncbi:hypothetical protein B0H66DRAFT_578770 [Apodospora peruviana]|uniref:Protein kinase domain-containing protein n=1 Tax=Apodospora peruviana TaxID=516989 RepID=A0AAE0HSF6_9PEZI|nr:hypothetical protein B0H66DRAFT_578770 [Apodospora peruviana]
MARLLSTDAVLLGRLSSYTIGKNCTSRPTKGQCTSQGRFSSHPPSASTNQHQPASRNLSPILKRYQSETRFLRPLVDDIHDPADPPSIVLCYLDSDMLTESNKKRLKQVARCVLEVLRLLHKDGMRFSDIQLGDCGGVVSQDSSFAKEGHFIGAAFTRSPEATFQLPWGTATDIWSFGAAMLSLVFGGGYHLFNPKIEKRMHRFLGPYPQSYKDFKDENTITIINSINAQGPLAMPFHRVGRREAAAEELLADVWLTEESLDTRDPLPGEEVSSHISRSN